MIVLMVYDCDCIEFEFIYGDLMTLVAWTIRSLVANELQKSGRGLSIRVILAYTWRDCKSDEIPVRIVSTAGL
jgi:hypothetical protein